ncbi:MAG: type II toxin-antitoxin system VapC family toxin [Verrucomicrobiaceae bacterium]|nr:type II toxin-antitoxin system VapC family toxin [Verrucomicrobiaceae bacterium]
MTFYADTSWWLACKSNRDQHHAAAISLFDIDPAADVLWTPWHRVEVFNSFRQAERHGLIQSGESRQMIRLLEHEIKLGYWTHREFHWTNAIREACQISERHSSNMTVRGMDLFHIAVACELNADVFLSFDEDQLQLAKAAGLSIQRLR